jgi:hypothetical protein
MQRNHEIYEIERACRALSQVLAYVTQRGMVLGGKAASI